MPIMTMLVNSRPSRPVGHSAERVARDQHLRHDLGAAQVAHQRHGAGVAEAAGQRAADLGRDAQGAPVVLRDEDGLDLLAVGEAQQPLAGAVARSAARPRSRAAPPRSLPPSCSRSVLGQRGHGLERGGAAVVEPVEQLARAQAPPAARARPAIASWPASAARSSPIRLGRPSAASGFIVGGSFGTGSPHRLEGGGEAAQRVGVQRIGVAGRGAAHGHADAALHRGDQGLVLVVGAGPGMLAVGEQLERRPSTLTSTVLSLR